MPPLPWGWDTTIGTPQRHMDEKYDPLNFDLWATGLGEFYTAGSRQEHEFRMTRKLILTARRWTALADETIRRQTGYRRAEWEALFAIAVSDGPLATVDLAVRMSLSWPSLLRTLRQLEDARLIERETGTQDRRQRLITIAPEGLQVVHEVQQIMNALRSEVLADLGDDDILASEQVLDRMMRAVMDR